MKRPEVKPWGVVVTAAMLIALSVYTGTGRGWALLSAVARLLSLSTAIGKELLWTCKPVPQAPGVHSNGQDGGDVPPLSVLRQGSVAS